MSSTRNTYAPPFDRATSQPTRADAADPRCRSPVGDGAKRPRYMPCELPPLDRDEPRDVFPLGLEEHGTAPWRRRDLLDDVGRARNGGAVHFDDHVTVLELAV